MSINVWVHLLIFWSHLVSAKTDQYSKFELFYNTPFTQGNSTKNKMVMPKNTIEHLSGILENKNGQCELSFVNDKKEMIKKTTKECERILVLLTQNWPQKKMVLKLQSLSPHLPVIKVSRTDLNGHIKTIYSPLRGPGSCAGKNDCHSHQAKGIDLAIQEWFQLLLGPTGQK